MNSPDSATTPRNKIQAAASWFEIPTQDFARAIAFYQTVLDRELQRIDFGGSEIAIFPHDPDAPGGCLMQSMAQPAGAQGTLLYLDCSPSLDAALARITAAGGNVVLPRTALPPGMGFFAHIADTEGNHVGLHALN